jgi:hypothetical protein
MSSLLSSMGRTEINQTTGVQDFSTGVPWTPKAGIYWMSSGVDDNLKQANMRFSFGFADDGGNQRSASMRCRDNRSVVSDTIRVASNSHVVTFINNNNGSFAGTADFGSFAAGKSVLDWDNALGNAFNLSHMYFGGNTLLTKAGSYTSHSSNNTDQAKTGVGFKPQVIFFTGNTPPDLVETTDDAATISIGFAVQGPDGTITQGCFGWGEQDNSSTSSCESVASVARCARCFEVTGTINQSLEFVSFDNDGFTAKTRDSGGVEDYIFLAMADPLDPIVGKVVAHTSKTSTEATTDGHGRKAVTGLGFVPQCLFHLATHAGTLDSVVSNANADCVGISAYSVEGDVEFSDCFISQDGQTTTACDGFNDTKGGHTQFGGGSTTGLTWDTDSIDSDGWTDDFTQTLGTAKQIVTLALGKKNEVASVMLGANF